MLLVDGLSPNERRLLRLNDLVAGLNALRSTEENKKVSVGVAGCLRSATISGGRIHVRLRGRFGPSLGLLELCLRHY